MTDTKEKNSIPVKIKKDYFEEFNEKMIDFIDKSEQTNRSTEKSLVSKECSVSIRDNNISISAGNYVQSKYSDMGAIENISFTDISKCNDRILDCEELIINNHKLNRKIYELSDFKEVLVSDINKNPGIVGALTMFGTVLVKCWEPNLNRYVLIRRLINMPVFSPALISADVHPGLKITPDSSRIEKMQKDLFSMGIMSESDFYKQASKYKSEQIQNERKSEAEKIKEMQTQKSSGQNEKTTDLIKKKDTSTAKNAEESYTVTIDKKNCRLYLNKNNKKINEWPVAIGKNCGQKESDGDGKTPTGNFVIENIDDSSSWEYDFNDGIGKIKGAFGPYFISLKTGFEGFGICGTHNEEIIGTRATNGCIKLKNSDLLDLCKYIKVGTQITIKE